MLIFRKIGQWITAFEDVLAGKNAGAELQNELIRMYGRSERLQAERIRAYIRLLEHAASVLAADEPVLLVHSPGRVNLMGRHVDHQGGHCNLMTIGFETLAAVRPRQYRVRSRRQAFPRR